MAPFLSTSTLMRLIPLFSHSLTTQGAMALQGPHQVAWKSTRVLSAFWRRALNCSGVSASWDIDQNIFFKLYRIYQTLFTYMSRNLPFTTVLNFTITSIFHYQLFQLTQTHTSTRLSLLISSGQSRLPAPQSPQQHFIIPATFPSDRQKQPRCHQKASAILNFLDCLTDNCRSSSEDSRAWKILDNVQQLKTPTISVLLILVLLILSQLFNLFDLFLDCCQQDLRRVLQFLIGLFGLSRDRDYILQSLLLVGQSLSDDLRCQSEYFGSMGQDADVLVNRQFFVGQHFETFVDLPEPSFGAVDDLIDLSFLLGDGHDCPMLSIIQIQSIPIRSL